MESTGGSLLSTLIVYIVIAIPIAILNAKIAKRKGKSEFWWGWICLFPVIGIILGYFFAIYLASLPDKDIVEKLNKLLNASEKI